MTPEQLERAVWHQNSTSTMILKCCVKDGSAVLAGIQDRGDLGYSWGVTGHYLQLAKTRATAMRRARAAVRDAHPAPARAELLRAAKEER